MIVESQTHSLFHTESFSVRSLYLFYQPHIMNYRTTATITTNISWCEIMSLLKFHFYHGTSLRFQRQQWTMIHFSNYWGILLKSRGRLFLVCFRRLNDQMIIGEELRTMFHLFKLNALCLIKLYIPVRNNYLMRKKLILNHGSSHQHQMNCKISVSHKSANLNVFNLLRKHVFSLYLESLPFLYPK